MKNMEIYKRKLIPLEEALTHVRSHHEIVCALGGCEPVGFLSSLHTVKDRVEDVSVVNALTAGEYDFYMKPEMKGHFTLNSWFYTAGCRKAHKYGTVSFVPLQLHEFTRKRLFHYSPNIFVGAVSPMDKHGYFSLSLSTVMEKDFIEQADLVIMEVNPRLPRSYGDTHVHISEIDYLVESDRSVPTLPPVKLSEKDLQIGSYVADLIEDGSTLQIGIGNIPGAIAHNLTHKRDLGIHTEIFSDSVLDLYEAGAVTNKKKTLWKNKFVADCIIGTERLYDFIDDNMAVELHRGSVINDPAVIGKNNKMVSINSALAIDLTGQCCAESIGSRLFSGTGGHREFISGAQESEGGKSIIAFYAGAKKDTISHILPAFESGTVVTTSRVDVDYVVTEYGVASLRGRSIKDRVNELINIAHPDFRDYLSSEAKRLMIW